MSIVNAVPAEIMLSVDPDFLQIVANNLVGNAVKYGSQGGVVRISALETGAKAQVEVYNDGVPLTSSERDLLFKKFSRVKNDVTRTIQGTGLGLFVSREIIEKHGGRIWVESREKGNAFIFQL
jgi:signal transduction histidine kinase